MRAEGSSFGAVQRNSCADQVDPSWPCQASPEYSLEVRVGRIHPEGRRMPRQVARDFSVLVVATFIGMPYGVMLAHCPRSLAAGTIASGILLAIAWSSVWRRIARTAALQKHFRRRFFWVPIATYAILWAVLSPFLGNNTGIAAVALSLSTLAGCCLGLGIEP